MMKNTQKKLKAKHFRYLSMENIENPMGYVNNFYKTETNLASWLDNLNTLVNASFCAKMKSSHGQSNGYHCKKLIEQVEFAYSIFVRYNLKRKKGNLDFSPVDYRQLQSLNNQKTVTTERWIFETLSLFFSFQNLRGWYEILDQIWVNLIYEGESIYGWNRIGEENLIIIKELFTRLAIALDLIHEIGEFPALKERGPLTMETEKNLIAEDNKRPTNEGIDTNDFDKNSSTLKTIKEKINIKIKYPFGIESLCDLQNLCLEFNKYIEINRKDWNELFEFTAPEIFFSSYSVIKEILDVIAQNINDIYSMYTASNRPDIDDYYKSWVQDKNIQFLSKSELQSPEHYLYLIYTSYDPFDWTINLDELFRVFLTLNKDKIIYDVKLPIHFLLDLKRSSNSAM